MKIARGSYLVKGLTLLAGINVFIPIIPLPLFVLVILAVQLFALNKYDNAFVFLVLGTVIGAFFAQHGIRFVGVVAMIAGAVIVWKDIMDSFSIWKGNLFFILFVLFYLFLSVHTTNGGDFATTKLYTTIQTVFISIIAYTHLFLFSQKHNGRNLSLMFLTYALFMIMVMNDLFGTNITLSEMLSFGTYRDEYSIYKSDESNIFSFNYQTIGLYACLGYSLYLLSYKKHTIRDNVFVWIIAAVIVVFSTARQALLMLAIITLLQLFVTKHKSYVKILGIIFFVGIAYMWFSGLGKDQQQFIQSDYEFSDKSNRSLLRIAAINSFLEHPLFGVGYGRFVFGNEYGINEHNIFIELLAELGILGTLFLVIPLIFISFPFRNKKKPLHLYISFIAIISAYFIHFLVSSHFCEGVVLFILIPLLRFAFINNKTLCE